MNDLEPKTIAIEKNMIFRLRQFHHLLPVKAFILLLLLLFNTFESKAQLQASFTLTNASGCAPLTVQFNNTSSGAVSYSWDFGDGNTSVLSNPSDVYTTTGNYTIKLVAYDVNGQADSIVVQNAVSVMQQPVASFTANVTSACLSNNVISFSNLSSSYDSCLWDFGDGVISSQVNPVHTYTTAGVFSVTLICFNTSYGCSNSFTRNQYITIGTSPVPIVNVNVNSSCNPAQLFSFTASATGAVSYHWNFGDNTTSNLQNPGHSYASPGVYSVTLITASSLGCTDTLVLNNYIELKSNPVPTVSLPDTSGCLPFYFHFSITIPTTSSLWTFGDGDSTTILNGFHMYDTAGTYTATLIATYANGCSNSISMNNVQALPTPNALFTISNAQGCSPLQVQFNNTSTGGNSYLWDFGDGSISSAFSPSHTYTSNGYFYVNLTAFNSTGCSLKYGPVAVSVLGPGANIFADITSGCPPLTVNFIGNPTGNTGYYWNFGDGSTSTLPNPQHIYNSLGNYIVTLAVTNWNGCTDTSVNPLTIHVATTSSNFVPPAPVFGCAPMFVNLSDNTPGASTWLWDFGDGSTGSGQNTSHMYSTPGTYVVSLNSGISAGGCPQVINDFSTFIVGGGIANFSYTQTICPPYIATFHDSSTNAISWYWDFGDGSSSTLQNPNHTYVNPGVYNVSLTITTADGCSVTCIHNYALSFEPLFANATAFTTDTVLPMTVTFAANTTGATWWLWNFGDSTTSSLEDPVHIYTIPGPYIISLLIGNDSCSRLYNFAPTSIGVGGGVLGSSTDSIVAPLPQMGCAPFPINFHNPFINTISWMWYFGDGDSSALVNPSHLYTQPGTYNVSLYAHQTNGTIDSLIQTANVLVTGGVNADFSIARSNGCSGTTISLSANGTNINNYTWNFGDGTVSNLPNPVHTYPNNGLNYIISLFASDSSGCTDFMSKNIYASATNAVHASMQKACASDSFYFDCGNLLFNSYVWHFGDGDSSILPNVYHQYSDTGFFQVSLTVTDSTGCSQTIALPDPVQVFNPVAGFSIIYYPVCEGAAVIFTNTSTNADSYLWDFGDGTYSTAFNPPGYHTYSTPGFYTVSLTASKNNCSNTFSQPNNVYAQHTTIDFNYNPDGQCLPITITCTDLSTDVTTWQWDFGDGSFSTMQNPIHTFTQVPTGPITLTIWNANGCHLIKSLPNIQPTVASFALSDSSGCAPVSVSFQDSSSNVATWLWNFGDGSSSTLSNPQHSFLQNGYYNVQLIVQSTSGCRDTIQADSLIHVSNISVDFASNINSGCAPVIIDFSDLSVNADNWNWDFGDGSNSQQQDPTHVYTIPGLYDVKLVVSNTDGCTDSMTIPSMIRVNGPITGFIASDTSGCAPVNVQFTDTSLYAVTWQWNFGDGSASSVISPQHLYSNPGLYTVSLITADSIGCQSVYTYPYTITVNAVPIASFTLSDTIGCTPLQVYFNSNSADYDSLLWNFGDGHTLTSSSSVTYSYTVAGTFYPYLVAYTLAGCSDTMYLNQPVHVSLQPSAAFTAGITTGCAPLTAGFTNLSTDTLNTTTYLWDFGNGDTSNVLNPVYTFTVPGLYTVTLTVSNGSLCTSTIVQTAYIQVFDMKPPPASPIARVTVLDDTRVEITWQNSAVPDLGAYKLYRLNPATGVFDLLFTDLNPNNASIYPVTTYTDTLLQTLQNTYTYKLQTVDLCENALPLDSLVPHTTINITAQTQGKDIFLSWTPYLGCPINQYELYRNDPSTGNYHQIAIIPSSTFEYIDSTFVCPELYAYRVVATDLCGNTYSSSSDTSMAKPEAALNDQQVEIVRTTVIDDQNTLTEWKPPLLAPDKVIAYNIYRSETENGDYTLIGTVGPSAFNFLDYHAEVHQQNYFYRIEVVNQCNAATLLSNIGSSILLLGNPENTSTRLIWTSYKGWDTGVSKYVIEKQNANGIWETIKVVDGNTLEMEDK